MACAFDVARALVLVLFSTSVIASAAMIASVFAIHVPTSVSLGDDIVLSIKSISANPRRASCARSQVPAQH